MTKFYPNQWYNYGINVFKIFIFRYKVGNLVLRRRASGAVKCDFRPYIRQYSDCISNNIPPQMKILNMVIPILMQNCSFLHFECYKPHKATCHLTKCDVIIDVKPFLILYCRIYCRKFLTSSNQTSRYISKCIRMCCAMNVLHCIRKDLCEITLVLDQWF